MKNWILAGLLSAITIALAVYFIQRDDNDVQLSNEEYELVPIATQDLQRPLYLVSPPGDDERLFVLEQPGRIRIIKGDVLLAEPFLDLTDIVTDDANEQGLLGLAFHPEYAENGYFFVNFSEAETDGHTVITRFAVDPDSPDQALRDSYEEVLRIGQPYGNHNGGMLAFGPDGYLYIGMGDGGSGGDPQGNGQNTDTLLGTLLRLDVDELPYTIPPDNPFVGNEGGREEIWAYGLRNPWRFSFDRETGDLYIADVGQNALEEISFQPADSPGGENYGWNIYEGSRFYNRTSNPPETVFPIAEYGRAEGCSVTGGYVYRGEALPALQGQYFYADFCTGMIWTLEQQENEQWRNQEFLPSGLRICSFGEDTTGELYVIDCSGGVYRLEVKD